MKKAMAMFLCILMMAAFAQTALADSIKLNQQVTLDEECIFTLKSIKAYDVFMNQKSGDSKQWIIATTDVLNLTHDSFFVKAQTDVILRWIPAKPCLIHPLVQRTYHICIPRSRSGRRGGGQPDAVSHSLRQ